MFIVKQDQLTRLLKALPSSEKHAIRVAHKVTQRLTKYGEYQLRYYVSNINRSGRSTGKLASNIRADVSLLQKGATGLIRILDNANTRHKYIIEYGASRGQYRISPGKIMKFSESEWSNTSKPSSRKGYYYYSSVTRGPFGKRTSHEKTVNKIQRMYNSKFATEMPEELITIIRRL
jgi:hypothetical protein